MNPTKIIVHHSLTEDNQTVSWAAIKEYHVKTCGWRDIGYHYGIELIGNSYEILKGRMDNEEGAHCLGFNDCSLGICVIGNYDKQPPNAAQLELLAKLVRSLMEIYGIRQENVLGHWETYPLRGKQIEKSCPGVLFSMKDFRKML